MHDAVRSAIRLDASLVAPVAGAVTAVPVTVLFALGLALWSPTVTSGLALGALFVGLAARINGPRLAASAMALDTLGLTVSALVGSACAGVGWLHISTLVVWCFVGGLVVALGPARSVVGIQGVMAIIIFGRAPHSVGASVALALAVLVGGAVQTAVQLVVRVPFGLRPQRSATALVYRQLAELAGGRKESSPAAARSADTAQTLLGSGALFGRPDVQALRGMVDEARRMRLELIAIGGLVRRLPDELESDQALDRVREKLHLFLLAISDAVTGSGSRGHPPLDPEAGAWLAFRQAMDDLEAGIGLRPWAGGATALVLAHFRSLRGQLRAAARLVGRATDAPAGSVLRVGRPRAHPVAADLRTIWDVLAENLTTTSPAFRHAVRLAVVVPVLDIGFQHSGLARSYWIALSAAVVLRPDYTATMSRGLARVGGTVVGVGAIGAIVGGLHPGAAAVVVLVALTGWGAFSFYQSNYALGVAFLTGLVLILTGVGQPATLALAGYRLVDSVIGGSVALVAYLLWPTWSKAEAQQSLAKLVAAQGRYVSAVLAGLSTKAPRDPEELRRLGRLARLAYIDAQSAVGRSLKEPTAKRIDPDVSQGILAALRRLIRAAHSLRTETAVPPTLAGIDQFAQAVDRSFATVEDGLERNMSVDSLPPLRDMYHRIDEGSADDPAALPVLIQLDEMVNAVDTVGQLMGAGDQEHRR